MDSQISFPNVDDLDKLLKLCRQNGVLYLKLPTIEFRLSETLPIVKTSDIIEESLEEFPEASELDKAKLTDLKRMRQQQNVLKQLFNDV